MTPRKQAQIDSFLADLKAKMTVLDEDPDKDSIQQIRSEAQGYYDVLSRMPHLDNPEWREIHTMVCAVLSRTARAVPGGSRERAGL